MHQSWRQPLSQHFLRNRQLVDRLVRASSITSQDLVVEIGPGQGIITQALLNSAQRVIAVELDGRLCVSLRRQFAGQCAPGPQARLRLIHADILATPLPREPYKVFASIPYSITADIMRKLLLGANPPDAAWLVVQREAAIKVMPAQPDQGAHSLAAMLHYPWWVARIAHRFRRADFAPPPRVDSVLLALTRRPAPLLDARQRALYFDFAAHAFGRDRSASRTAPAAFVQRFLGFARAARREQLLKVRGAYGRLCAQQQRLEKIHRTRTDEGWLRHKPGCTGARRGSRR